MSQNVELETWKHEVKTKIRKMVDDWERRFPPEDDDTFYTLALRRAIDIVDGGSPNLGP